MKLKLMWQDGKRVVTFAAEDFRKLADVLDHAAMPLGKTDIRDDADEVMEAIENAINRLDEEGNRR